MVYEGFALMKKTKCFGGTFIISSYDSKLQVMQQNIDGKLQDFSSQLSAANSKVAALDTAARQIEAAVQQISQANYPGGQQEQRTNGILDTQSHPVHEAPHWRQK